MAFRGTDDLARLIVRELRRTVSEAGLTGDKEG
jgi:hypothetical protein